MDTPFSPLGIIFHNLSLSHIILDPIFWLHHSFLDKLWSDHQVVFAQTNIPQYHGQHRGRPVFVTDFLEGTMWRVEDVLDTRVV